MKRLSQLPILLICFLSIIYISCSSDDNRQITNDSENTPIETITKISESLATSGCSNVVIFNGYAYAACGEELEIISLESGERNLLNIAANDIAVDPSNQTLFIQAQNIIHALSISEPLNPSIIATSTTNFGIFSGIDAANGIVVVSAGTRNSNTQVYTFDGNQFTLTENGIEIVDNVTGNPDVHVTETLNGAKAFYSQDLGAVTNWGIQIIDFDINGKVIDNDEVITLTAQRFSGGFASISPANFPLESEFLNNKLYVAHFAINGIEVVDLDNNNSLSQIALGYQPINIATSGTSLFVIGSSSDVISVIDPSNNEINTIILDQLQQPRGIAVSEEYIAIADRIEGLIVVKRQ